MRYCREQLNSHSEAEVRILWQRRLLEYLKRKKLLSEEEITYYYKRFARGFNVYFQPIPQEEPEALFDSASYIADGYFHNSQITKIDYERKTVTFRSKAYVDPHSKEKRFRVTTMDAFEFMAGMLYFIPEKHSKTIRYYGFYKKQKNILERVRTKALWAEAIQRCFNRDPKICPRCAVSMKCITFTPGNTRKAFAYLLNNHVLVEGYYYLHSPRSRAKPK